jgi:hypothetical protein
MKQFSTCCTLIVFLALALFPGSLQAQSDNQALEDHMRQVKRKISEKRDSAFSTIMQMTDEQSKAFRPLQKAYTKEFKALEKKGQQLTREFSEVFDKLTDQSAADLGKRYFGIQKEKLELQEKYLKQMSEEVSPVIAVQFLQLERRFESQIENEFMKYAPLAE